MTAPLVIDCAGAVGGGSARFLKELKEYLAVNATDDVRLIGDNSQLTVKWLINRELAAINAHRRISLNNAGFINPTGVNITLLRNILQFATEAQIQALGFSPPRRLRLQTPLVRRLAKMSETLVVPSTRMAEQVSEVCPSLEGRIVVKFHPVTQPPWAGEEPSRPRNVLVPIVPQPYKNLDQHLPEFLEATSHIPGDPIRLIIPSEAEALPDLNGHDRVTFIGQKNAKELEKWWRSSGAVFFPVEFESFGYALAEARVYGRHVIAQSTPQNQEIAGRALCPYKRGDTDSLRNAVVEAVAGRPIPDPEPFDAGSYFDWLLHGPQPQSGPIG